MFSRKLCNDNVHVEFTSQLARITIYHNVNKNPKKVLRSMKYCISIFLRIANTEIFSAVYVMTKV